MFPLKLLNRELLNKLRENEDMAISGVVLDAVLTIDSFVNTNTETSF